MPQLTFTRRSNSENLISGLKDFGLNPTEWEIHDIKKNSQKQEKCFLIRAKNDFDFQMLGWAKKSKSTLQWDRLKLLSL